MDMESENLLNPSRVYPGYELFTVPVAERLAKTGEVRPFLNARQLHRLDRPSDLKHQERHNTSMASVLGFARGEFNNDYQGKLPKLSKTYTPGDAVFLKEDDYIISRKAKAGPEGIRYFELYIESPFLVKKGLQKQLMTNEILNTPPVGQQYKAKQQIETTKKLKKELSTNITLNPDIPGQEFTEAQERAVKEGMMPGGKKTRKHRMSRRKTRKYRR